LDIRSYTPPSRLQLLTDLDDFDSPRDDEQISDDDMEEDEMSEEEEEEEEDNDDDDDDDEYPNVVSQIMKKVCNLIYIYNNKHETMYVNTLNFIYY
jgi:hypothetical protein